MYAAGLLGTTSPPWLLAVLLAVVGAGLGFFVQVSLLAGQNAVDHADLGVATGALNFAKTLGGAFGAVVFGAILTGHLGAGAMAAFQAVFWWTVPFMGLALLLVLIMREQPLSDEMIEVAEY